MAWSRWRGVATVNAEPGCLKDVDTARLLMRWTAGSASRQRCSSRCSWPATWFRSAPGWHAITRRSADFTVVEGRETGVLLTREAYHNMRDDEFAAAFWYYLPVTKNRLGDLGIAAQSIERVAPMNANSFRRRQNRDAGPIGFGYSVSASDGALAALEDIAASGVARCVPRTQRGRPVTARSRPGVLPAPARKHFAACRAVGTLAVAALGSSVQHPALNDPSLGRVPQPPRRPRLVLAGAEEVRRRPHRPAGVVLPRRVRGGHAFHSPLCGSRNAAEVGHRHAARVPCGIAGRWTTAPGR